MSDTGSDGEEISRHGSRRSGTDVAPTEQQMSSEPDWSTETPSDTPLHRFTVHRGMVVAVVIETPDWYSGLIQAAAARVRIEGAN
jgi:hypothetical protein